jgi:tripartite-type tricarboxylate transporter receptor subunit TctC
MLSAREAGLMSCTPSLQRKTMKILLWTAWCAAVMGAASVAMAQNYPTRVIRIIGQKLTEAWGVAVVVDNRPAAGGMLGTELVAKAPPDGYTLLGANPGPLTVAPSLHAKLAYDPVRQLEPVILVTHTTSVLAVHPSVPAKSIRELIALAKAQPGKLTYGSPGIGTVGHLTFELFNTQAGTKMTHVPYKGTAQATNDMLAGQIDLRTFSIPVAAPLMKNGRVRVLGINGRRRSPLLPDVPTVSEAGLPGFESNNWNGIMTPAGTPREIIMKLYDEIMRRVLKSELRDQLIRDGYDIAGLGPDEFREFMKNETAKWAKVIKAANVKAD